MQTTFRFFVVAAFFCACSSAFADVLVYSFALATDSRHGSGLLVGVPDPNTPGAVDILAAAGTFYGQSLSLVTPGATSTGYATDGKFDYNNVLYPSGIPTDVNGLLFSENNDPHSLLNVFYDTPYLAAEGADVTSPDSPYAGDAFGASLTVQQITQTPEPSSFALCGSGLAALTYSIRRLRRRA